MDASQANPERSDRNFNQRAGRPRTFTGGQGCPSARIGG
jgi:hypothetical protein